MMKSISFLLCSTSAQRWILIASLILLVLVSACKTTDLANPDISLPTDTSVLLTTPLQIITQTNEQPTDTLTLVPTSATQEPTAVSSPPPTITFPDHLPQLGDTLVRDADGMMMVYLPGGSFEMGSRDTQIAEALKDCDQYLISGECPKELFANESPQHLVSLDSFWIDQTEVSYAQYERCIAVGICSDPRCSVPESFNRPDLPASCITWYDAQNFCQWVGARLPSEAEWEYVARGPDGNIFPWGNVYDRTRLNYCDNRCLAGWKDGDYNDGFPFLAPVGSFPSGASWCGALDMAGNALEWVADWYDADYYSVSVVENPQGPESGQSRVMRGGAANQLISYTRSAWRSPAAPVHRYDFLGFRCASSPPR